MDHVIIHMVSNTEMTSHFVTWSSKTSLTKVSELNDYLFIAVCSDSTFLAVHSHVIRELCNDSLITNNHYHSNNNEMLSGFRNSTTFLKEK